MRELGLTAPVLIERSPSFDSMSPRRLRIFGPIRLDIEPPIQFPASILNSLFQVSASRLTTVIHKKGFKSRSRFLFSLVQGKSVPSFSSPVHDWTFFSHIPRTLLIESPERLFSSSNLGRLQIKTTSGSSSRVISIFSENAFKSIFKIPDDLPDDGGIVGEGNWSSDPPSP